MAAIDSYFLAQNLVILLLELITLENIFLNPFFRKSPINRFHLNERNKKIFFWIYTIIILIIIFYFYDANVGVYKESNHWLIIIFIIFNLALNILTYLGKYKFTKRELFKGVMFLAVIWVFLIPSILVSACIYFPSLDRKPDWYSYTMEFISDNKTYNVSIQAANYVSTMHGFFIDSPLTLEIYDGYIRFNKGEIPKNSTIELRIDPMPHPYNKKTNKEMNTFITLQTQTNDSHNFVLILPKEPTIFAYTYSGVKDFSYVLLLNRNEFTTYTVKNRIEIETGEIKVQFDLSRVVLLLTIWIIFFAILPFVDKILNWYVDNHPLNFNDDMTNIGYI